MTTPPNHNTADQSGADERAKFEALLNIHSRRRNEHGDYVLPSIQDRWVGWHACALASTQPAPQAAQDVSELQRFACFENEDGVYEHQYGSYVMFRDVVNLISQATATPQPFPAPAVQSGDLDIAVSVFKSLFFNDGVEGESLDEQLRRAMRAAFISSGQAIAQTAQAVRTVQANPVAWIDQYALDELRDNDQFCSISTSIYCHILKDGKTPLYAAPPAPAIAVEALRNQALEEAALSCKNTMLMNVESYCGATASLCAERIRALKSAPAAKGNAPDEVKS